MDCAVAAIVAFVRRVGRSAGVQRRPGPNCDLRQPCGRSLNSTLTVYIDHNADMAGLKTRSPIPVMMLMFLLFPPSLLPPPSSFAVFLMVSVFVTLTLGQVSDDESRGSE